SGWREKADFTLERMAFSSLYDHFGGGFHRSAADRGWRQPQFEKRLGDNALLLRVYLEWYRATRNPAAIPIMEGIGAYLLEELFDPASGLFFDHQAGDAPGTEPGAYYTWTADEWTAGLDPEERQAALLAFELRARSAPARTMGDADIAKRLGWSIDRVQAILRQVREKVSAQRRRRSRPPVEPVAFAQSNGMAVSALLQWGLLVDHAAVRDTALRVLDRLWEQGWSDTEGMGRSLRQGRWTRPGLLTDHVWVLTALLDAYEATDDTQYLERAQALARFIETAFADPAGGGYVDRAQGPSGASAPSEGLLALPRKPYFDQADAPAENPLLALAFDRLALLADAPDWRIVAEGILLALAGVHPDSVNDRMASYAQAVLRHLRPPTRVFVSVPAPGATHAALIAVARQSKRPGVMVRTLRPGQALPPLSAASRAAATALIASGKTQAIVCIATTCSRPTADPGELARTLDNPPPAPRTP
ncbi:MAG: thioredoxin domain-containing protein, partial [Deltaproteobacteria bacterium]|nr:thioredoxin domain-containing protein [Deltaproteobacteria bacterium]